MHREQAGGWHPALTAASTPRWGANQQAGRLGNLFYVCLYLATGKLLHGWVWAEVPTRVTRNSEDCKKRRQALLSVNYARVPPHGVPCLHFRVRGLNFGETPPYDELHGYLR